MRRFFPAPCPAGRRPSGPVTFHTSERRHECRPPLPLPERTASLQPARLPRRLRRRAHRHPHGRPPGHGLCPHRRGAPAIRHLCLHAAGHRGRPLGVGPLSGRRPHQRHLHGAVHHHEHGQHRRHHRGQSARRGPHALHLRHRPALRPHPGGHGPCPSGRAGQFHLPFGHGGLLRRCGPAHRVGPAQDRAGPALLPGTGILPPDRSRHPQLHSSQHLVPAGLRGHHPADPTFQAHLAPLPGHPGGPGHHLRRLGPAGSPRAGRAPGGRHPQRGPAPFPAPGLRHGLHPRPVHARAGHRPAGRRGIPGHRQAAGGHPRRPLRRQPGTHRPGPRQHRRRPHLRHPRLRLLHPQRPGGHQRRPQPHGHGLFGPAGPAHALRHGAAGQLAAHACPGGRAAAHLGEHDRHPGHPPLPAGHAHRPLGAAHHLRVHPAPRSGAGRIHRRAALPDPLHLQGGPSPGTPPAGHGPAHALCPGQHARRPGGLRHRRHALLRRHP